VHKVAGCCSLCDKEVYEVLKRFPNREPQTLGKEIDVVKKTFVLTNGNHFTLTFCSECDPEPKDYPGLWKKVLRTFVREQSDEFRAMIDQPPITDDRHKGWMTVLNNQAILGKYA